MKRETKEAPSTTPSTESKNIVDVLAQKREVLLKCCPLPPQMANRAMEVLAGIVRSTPAVQHCTPGSVLRAAWDIAKIGLVPDPQLGQVYLVPYSGRLTVVVGYRGFIELARRAGATLEAVQIVRRGDEFDYGVDQSGVHLNWRPADLSKPGAQPGEIIGGFTILKTATGDRIITFIPWREIERRRNRSQAWRSGKTDTPWRTDEETMIRKTLIRASVTTWTLSPEADIMAIERLHRAVAIDEASERGEILPPEPQAVDELGIIEGEWMESESPEEPNGERVAVDLDNLMKK